MIQVHCASYWFCCGPTAALLVLAVGLKRQCLCRAMIPQLYYMLVGHAATSLLMIRLSLCCTVPQYWLRFYSIHRHHYYYCCCCWVKDLLVNTTCTFTVHNINNSTEVVALL